MGTVVSFSRELAAWYLRSCALESTKIATKSNLGDKNEGFLVENEPKMLGMGYLIYKTPVRSF